MAPRPITRFSRACRLAVALACLAPTARAGEGNGVSAGLLLSQDTSARAAGLAGTMGAMRDDVSALGYNPASLASLSSNHVVLGYQRGLVDDTNSQIQFGHPLRDAGFGVSLSLYQGGRMDYIEGGVNRGSVVSQRDVAGAIGYAHAVGRLALGASAKYLSSELAEAESASTPALDFGATVDASNRLRFAAALQNLGASLRYGDERSRVARTARAGFSYLLLPNRSQTLVLVDFPYLLNEARLEAAVGLESLAGPIAFRAGYTTGVDLGGLTLGAGFALSGFTFDYAFGLVKELQSSHRASLSYRFGATSPDSSLATFGAPARTTPAGRSRSVHSATIDGDVTPRKDPVALNPPVQPSEPVPVFQGVGRGNCADEKAESSIIFYGKGRADCGPALAPISPDFTRESKPSDPAVNQQ